MTTTRSVLFDTNILVYNQDKDSPHYELAHDWHQKVSQGKIQGILSSQNLLELTAVMTSPKHLVKPMSARQVTLEINAYQHDSNFRLIYPNANTIEVFSLLLKRYDLKNARQSFDVFLVATMLSNNITQILTLNKKDFKMFKEITLL